MCESDNNLPIKGNKRDRYLKICIYTDWVPTKTLSIPIEFSMTTSIVMNLVSMYNKVIMRNVIRTLTAPPNGKLLYLCLYFKNDTKI